MIETEEQRYCFAEFEVDAVKRRLIKDGQTVSLNPKTFDLLLTLIENHGKILTKNELLDTVWENQFVEENNLTVHISALRKALGEKKNENRFLVTVPGKGYRFVADVRLPLDEESGAAVIFETSNTNTPDNKQDALLFSSSDKFGDDHPIIGREREITEIKNLLRRGDARLVMLSDAGKTRLKQAFADELADDFPDGVFFIEFTPVNIAEAVVPTIAQTLGVKESGNKSLQNALKDFLCKRRILLVLDNFEPISSAAPLLREILEAAEFLKILVTSRAAAIKWHPQPENAADSQTNNDDESAEIIIENHTFSRVLFENFEEQSDQILPEKIINPQTVSKSLEKQKAAVKTYSSSSLFYLIPGAILAAVIAVMLFWQSGQINETKQFSISKLTSNGKVSAAALTPDGKYTVFSQTENDGESLWLRQIETGSQTQILPYKSVKYIGLAVSPDGNLIYATVFGGGMSDPQIWKMPLLGGTIEEIKNIKTGAAVSLSPDGKRFAFTESRSALKETHFGIADADGANKQILIRAKDDERSFPNFDTTPAAWSPDGKEIACIIEKKSSDGGRKSTILLINPLDGNEKYISEQHWDYIKHLVWTDAENLAFISYTSEPWHGEIRSISRATGETVQITNDLNNYSRLASANGNLLTVRKNAVSRVSIGEFDEDKTRFNPREVFKESGYIANVAYGANNSIFYSSSESGKSEIWRMNADGTNRTQLTVNANVTFGLSVSPADGSIVFCSTENSKHSLKLSDAKGKNVQSLVSGTEDVFPNFTPDGQSVIFQRGLNNKTLTLWRFDLSDGKITRLTNTQASHPAVSPDGTQTAFFFMDQKIDNLWRVGLISSSDGTFTGKINLPAKATDRRLRWHPNGKYLSTVYSSGKDVCILLLSAAGETQELCGMGEGEVEWFEWSKDGNQILISQSVLTKDIILLK